MKSLILCFDGASRPNPGKSACAYVIIDEHSEIIEQAGKFLGEGTNNIAEYLGLILGLLACVKHKPEKLIIYSDSNLVIQQINGKYRVKDEELKKLHLIATETLKIFKETEIFYVSHQKNKAHSLAQAYLENELF